MPNVDTVEITDTEANSVAVLSVAENVTGNFTIDRENNKKLVGSWRYLELNIEEDFLWLVLNRFKYSGGDATNGTFTFKQFSDVKCMVFGVPVRDLSSDYIPFFYNNEASCDFMTIVTEAVYERFTGFSSNQQYNSPLIEVQENVYEREPFYINDRNGDLFSGSEEIIDIWFFTESKVDVNYLSGGRLREVFAYGSYTLVHYIFSDYYDRIGVRLRLISDVEYIKGLAIFFSHKGISYFTNNTQDIFGTYSLYYPQSLKSGGDKPVDTMQVNYINWLKTVRYKDDYDDKGFIIDDRENKPDILIKRFSNLFKVKGAANSDIDGYPVSSRGTFLIY